MMGINHLADYRLNRRLRRLPSVTVDLTQLETVVTPMRRLPSATEAVRTSKLAWAASLAITRK